MGFDNFACLLDKLMHIRKGQPLYLKDLSLGEDLRGSKRKILGELIHQTIKEEMQIRRRNASRKTYIGTSGWKGKEREKERVGREKSYKKGSESPIGRKESISTLTSMAPMTSNIKLSAKLLYYTTCHPQMDGQTEVFVQSLYDKARLHMEKKGEQYARSANKRRKEVIFKERDLV
ncbi:hypothetical protein CR513_12528, partial [Mucuna pruriens]